MKKAIYAGSFDPITFGHISVITSALRVVDHLCVGIGINNKKRTLLSQSQRLQLVEKTLETYFGDMATSKRVSVVCFDNLLVEKAKEIGATMLIRGVRDEADFAYEMRMASINGALDSALQTVFIPPRNDTRFISSTHVREIARLKGDLTPFVPDFVVDAINQK